MNFLGLGSRLEDKKSREIVFELAYEQGKAIVETMRLHIYREDETLFPLAMKLISKEELKEMDLHQNNLIQFILLFFTSQHSSLPARERNLQLL
ncbi:MAG: hypothetical protein IH784_10280 [Bacteroidetes bacterium]|nr:hypothetical protein [Bacteroidota bacterium]